MLVQLSVRERRFLEDRLENLTKEYWRVQHQIAELERRLILVRRSENRIERQRASGGKRTCVRLSRST